MAFSAEGLSIAVTSGRSGLLLPPIEIGCCRFRSKCRRRVNPTSAGEKVGMKEALRESESGETEPGARASHPHPPPLLGGAGRRAATRPQFPPPPLRYFLST